VSLVGLKDPSYQEPTSIRDGKTLITVSESWEVRYFFL